ncbi:unnamed protein product [Heligmosomoides polygyrus]|uniref:Transporter n=1 Tax=Heligmosomoides polygyrus TaxID=6339 RepID=A0A3P8FLH8_HELPZ|nr:unnamed protein product [Heligmosomoides polygyrus]
MPPSEDDVRASRRNLKFAGIEALITGLCDESRLLQRKREWFVGVVCIIYYFGSLPAISYGGQYVIPFLDEYGVSLSVLFIVTCEMVAVCWFYGIDRFSNDIKSMLGFYPGLYWRVCWMLCPIFIMIIFVMTVWQASLEPMQLPGYTFPKWSVGFGWFLRMLSVSSVPLFAIYMLSFAKGTFTEVSASITRHVGSSKSRSNLLKGVWSAVGGAADCRVHPISDSWSGLSAQANQTFHPSGVLLGCATYLPPLRGR